MGAHAYTPAQDARPTQVDRPWRSTARTIFQAVVGLAMMWGLIVETLGIDGTLPWVAASVAVTAGITRVMGLAPVEEWLRKFFPWLAAAPPPPVNVPDQEGM